jgi:hypothetical protein
MQREAGCQNTTGSPSLKLSSAEAPPRTLPGDKLVIWSDAVRENESNRRPRMITRQSITVGSCPWKGHGLNTFTGMYGLAQKIGVEATELARRLNGS